MKRSLVPMIMMLFPLLSCGRGVLPEYGNTLDRVDSMSVDLHAGTLDMVIHSSFGIGSCLLEFSRPLDADSVRLRLLYAGDREYSVCENLEIVVRYVESEREHIFSDQVRLEDGSLVLPLESSIDEIDVFWIDFYRS